MDWFKFYGKDWLTDLKVIQMSVEDRLCFITLLCLSSASDNGVVKKCDEHALIELTHLYDNPYETNNEYSRACGVLKRLNDNEMITIDNNGDVTVKNFSKRQGRSLTGYERVKKYRERQKAFENKVILNDNEMITDDNANDNVREDKRREEKNIYIGKITKKKEEEMYSYEKLDNEGNPIKKRLPKIKGETNKFLISIGCLWADLMKSRLGLKEEEIVLKNIYYPIRACYDREKWDKEGFKKLFLYFLNDPNIKDENKISFDLCLSQKYVAKYKMAQKLRPKTNASVSGEIIL